jgi:predicted DsbA family dithiol-disulfide isomerase
LQKASQQVGIPVALEWMPFLLNPNMSNEGESIEEHLAKKYGPAATQRFHDPNSPLRVMGRKAGIEFNNDRKMVNTKKAHALMEYFQSNLGHPVANQFMEDLYRIYFEEGKDINDEQLLAQTAATKYGVDVEQARRAMAPDFLKIVTEKDRENKHKYGVNGVPFFMIYPVDGKSPPTAFSGAYPVEVIAEQLEDAADM